jgi:hypothetical protein
VRACLDCLPCLARNATELARRSARGDAALEGRIAAAGMRILGAAAEAGYPLPPPCYARQLIDNALEMCGGAVPDPWAEEKRKSTELALRLMEQMGLSTNDNCHNCSQITNVDLSTGGTRSCASVAVAQERDPPEMSDFEKRLRLSIAGNILDFSIYADLDIAAAMETMAEAFKKPICGGHGVPALPGGAAGGSQLAATETDAINCVPPGDVLAELKRRMDEAKSILWIFDNCGEAVFDRLLMEPYRDKITLAVRGKPAFNDMTRAELEPSGLLPPDLYKCGGKIVSNDDGVPGVVDETCGDEFRAAFSSADLIIAKGQANFETMSERTDKPIAFLFLAKCPVVCRAIGAEPKTIQVIFNA